MDVKVYLNKNGACIDVLHNVKGIVERFGNYVVTVEDSDMRLNCVYYTKWQYTLEVVQ